MKALHPDRKYNPLPSMTVSEMILELQKHDPDMVVGAAWEGTLNAITTDNFRVIEGILEIDVENH